jgi:serine protease Do
MSTRKSTVFYGVLIALASMVVGMVIASRLDLSPASFASSFDVPASNSAPISGPIDSTTFRTIAKVASPSVVSIRTRAQQEARSLNDLFGLQVPGNPRRGGQQAPPETVQGAGSGFIIDKAGFILTNNHVIEDALEIEVKLSDMEDLPNVPWLPAKLVGSDPLTDAALIQLTELPEEPLQPLTFGDSSQMEQGDWVMAIGNPYRLSNTVTVGVVSAIGRPYATAPGRFEDFIQTDAAINRGNSGGPLLNLRGEVIGVNTMIVSDTAGGGNLGIGFAVPINTVRDILDQLHTGKVVRGRIGVNVDRASLTRSDIEELGLPTTGGALVNDLGEGSGPAKAAGMRAGDVIVEFNGKTVRNSSELVSMVTRTKPGTTVPVKVIRAKKPVTLNLTVDALDLEAESRITAPRERPLNEAPTDTGFGMAVEPVTPGVAKQLGLPQGRGGAVVAEVQPFSAASQAGIRTGDVILAVNDRAVTSVDEVGDALDRVVAGRTARILVWRDGREQLVRAVKR